MAKRADALEIWRQFGKPPMKCRRDVDWPKVFHHARHAADGQPAPGLAQLHPVAGGATAPG
jgi:hypothetical protein